MSALTFFSIVLTIGAVVAIIMSDTKFVRNGMKNPNQHNIELVSALFVLVISNAVLFFTLMKYMLKLLFTPW